jgi:hypothetical protein
MVDEKQIKSLLKKHFDVTGKVTINSTTGLVDVDGDVKLKKEIKTSQLPVSFGGVGGSFSCYNNNLVSLEGAPTSVGGGFDCRNNQLTSLEGAPALVGGNFYCTNNKLTSLEGAPKDVGGEFDCSNNQLTSLEGAPALVGGNFYCNSNQLSSLEGAPTSVGGGFYCNSNQLTSLEGAPTSVGGDFYCYYNNLVSLKGAPTSVGGNFWCDYNKNLPLLRLLAYQRIRRVLGASLQLDQILKKHAGTGRRGAIQAAREMLELGEQLQKEQALDHNPFEANARW